MRFPLNPRYAGASLRVLPSIVRRAPGCVVEGGRAPGCMAVPRLASSRVPAATYHSGHTSRRGHITLCSFRPRLLSSSHAGVFCATQRWLAPTWPGPQHFQGTGQATSILFPPQCARQQQSSQWR